MDTFKSLAKRRQDPGIKIGEEINNCVEDYLNNTHNTKKLPKSLPLDKLLVQDELRKLEHFRYRFKRYEDSKNLIRSK